MKRLLSVYMLLMIQAFSTEPLCFYVYNTPFYKAGTSVAVLPFKPFNSVAGLKRYFVALGNEKFRSPTEKPFTIDDFDFRNEPGTPPLENTVKLTTIEGHKGYLSFNPVSEKSDVLKEVERLSYQYIETFRLEYEAEKAPKPINPARSLASIRR